MQLERMRLFAEVVRHGNFSRAADSLAVSKGYLSQQVKLLEQELDKQLLVRNTRNMRLTSAGELLYEQAQPLLQLWRKTKTTLELNEQNLSGVIKCTAPVGVARYLLWPVFHHMMQDTPEVSFMVESGNTTRDLIADDFDFAVRLTNTPPQDMVARKLKRVDYLYVATPQYIEKRGEPLTPYDLEQHDCLLLPHWNHWAFKVPATAGNKSDEPLDMVPNGKLSASDNDLLKQACLKNMGITRLPNFMIADELSAGSLLPILSDYTFESRDLYVLYPQMKTRSQRVRMCLDKIVEEISA